MASAGSRPAGQGARRLPADAAGRADAGRAAGRRAILIVRDPRDVAPSLANHRRSTIDEAIEFLIDPAACFAAGARGQSLQFRQKLLDWSGHAASWLDQRELPVHLVRYEDLWAAPVATFRAALDFLGAGFSRAEVERAVDFARFERLQAQEQANGFIEWRPRDGEGSSSAAARARAGGAN